MPVETKYIEGVYAPIIVCDHCREVITDAGRGLASWVFEQPERVYFLHKGVCDREFNQGELVHWEELDRFLSDLQHNANVGAANV